MNEGENRNRGAQGYATEYQSDFANIRGHRNDLGAGHLWVFNGRAGRELLTHACKQLAVGDFAKSGSTESPICERTGTGGEPLGARGAGLLICQFRTRALTSIIIKRSRYLDKVKYEGLKEKCALVAGVGPVMRWEYAASLASV